VSARVILVDMVGGEESRIITRESGVPSDSLTLTDERLPGRFWFFHHDHWTAHNGVDVEIPCRVYECDRPAAR
jgi:hypothetical protein